jgi:von Willebrand factor type A domain/Aerotolerance regulator N-terminal
MGLEAPLALLGLAATLLPVLIHRLRKRELPRLALPTFALLARASAKSQHKRALSDLVLLLVRIAIVAFACLSLATPYVTAHVNLGDGQLGSAVFVIDDSLSMARDDGSGSLVEQARAQAREALAALPPGSEVAIVLAGRPARVVFPLSRDLAAAERALTAPLPALRRGDLERALELGLSQLGGARWPHRSLFVLSDFSRGNTLDAGARSVAGVQVLARRIGSEPTRCNVYLEQLHAAADPSRPAQSSVSAQVKSVCGPGAAPIERVKLEIRVGGTIAASSELALQAGQAKALLHVPTPDAEADPSASVQIVADDALAADNQAGVVLTRADAVRVLMVNGDPHPSSRSDELYYALRALTLVPDRWLALSLRNVDPLSFERSLLRDADVVVLANAPAPSEAMGQELVRFVQSGGGLIVFGGHRIDAQRYNAVLGPALATHIVGVGPSDAVGFSPVVDTQYLPEGLAGLREVKTRQRLLLERAPETPLSFEDGLPALAVRTVGDGRSALFATTIDPDWSDLPYRPGYLPLLAAMLRDAAGQAAIARTPLVPGDEVALPWPRLGRGLEVQRPDGSSREFTVDPKQRMLRYRETDAIGVFRVRAIGESGHGRRGAFVVNPPADEADVAWGALPESEAETGDYEPVRVHKPLSAPLLWALLLLALLEGAVRARRSLVPRTR